MSPKYPFPHTAKETIYLRIQAEILTGFSVCLLIKSSAITLSVLDSTLVSSFASKFYETERDNCRCINLKLRFIWIWLDPFERLSLSTKEFSLIMHPISWFRIIYRYAINQIIVLLFKIWFNGTFQCLPWSIPFTPLEIW